ncbi:MAG TPA: ATP-binding protein [Ktedonobacteraceae bacterium]
MIFLFFLCCFCEAGDTIINYEYAAGTDASRGQADLQAHNVLEICICDNGMGIPPEHLERIFERFHRVENGLTREVNGLGLGLPICKRIVELHQGSIWAESCPAGGSAFHVLLPVGEEEEIPTPLAGAKLR